MIYRTVIWKNPDEVHTPDNVDRDAWLNDAISSRDDFVNNYLSEATKISSIMQFDTEISYNDFKKKIDGTTIKWSDVLVFETKNAYYLYVKA